MTCIIYGVTLARVLSEADVVVGFCFAFIGILYSITSFIQTQRQLAIYISHDAYLVNTKMVLLSVIITLISYGVIIVFM